MLALKASTLGACGIRGGKLFHVVIVLTKKLYLNISMLVWYGWKSRGLILIDGMGEMVWPQLLYTIL